MDVREAQSVIESLRYGIPPEGYVRQFTVGRRSEIDELKSRLERRGNGALLLKANYGSGKTHLLKLIKEEALAQGYLVSLVTLDATSAIRFNRMDQIMSAILRGLEVPPPYSGRGIRAFFEFVMGVITIELSAQKPAGTFWHRVTNAGLWDYSSVLESSALFIALRAWATDKPEVHDLVEDWLSQPWNYLTERARLYTELIAKHRLSFREPRSERQLLNPVEGIFHFRQQEYRQSWAVLRDIYEMSVASNLKGFIILFDEFEDVLHSIRNIAHQQGAFWNLFQFYRGERFLGMTFFAVTPGFVEGCKERLRSKGLWDYDFQHFDKLPTYEMSSLRSDDLLDLAHRIEETYMAAFGPLGASNIGADLEAIVRAAMALPIQDRARHTIRTVVTSLDEIHSEDI